MQIKIFLKQNYLILIGVAVGTVAGFFYWQQIGCVSGACAITSSPVNTTLYGALMGGLTANLFKKETPKKEA